MKASGAQGLVVAMPSAKRLPRVWWLLWVWSLVKTQRVCCLWALTITDWDHGGIGFSRKLQMLLRWSGRVLHHHEFRLAEVKQVHKSDAESIMIQYARARTARMEGSVDKAKRDLQQMLEAYKVREPQCRRESKMQIYNNIYTYNIHITYIYIIYIYYIYIIYIYII